MSQDPNEIIVRCPCCDFAAPRSAWSVETQGLCLGERCTMTMRRWAMAVKARDSLTSTAAWEIVEAAAAVHGTQRWGAFPYRRHLRDVVARLWSALCPTDGRVSRLAAWAPHAIFAGATHDIIEDVTDGEAKLAALSQEWLLTPRRGVLLGRALTNKLDAAGVVDEAATWASIRHTGHVTVAAKLADRTSNNVTGKLTGYRPDLMATYEQQWPAMRAALFDADEARSEWMGQLWRQADAAFAGRLDEAV